jgi:ubiquinone/menaquinone biosynthesis C-methylase UbiE
MAELYFESGGLASTEYTQPPLDAAEVVAGERVLDVGCGRGEIVFQCAAQGALAVGLDFSQSAIDLCNETRERHDPDLRSRSEFVCGDAQAMPFANGAFDCIFLLDVVEHLARRELLATLREIRRVLAPSGRLVVHTTPNRWSRSYGYALKAVILRLARRPVPTDPIVSHFEHHRSDPEYDSRTLFLHINELSIVELKWMLVRAGYRSRVWFGESGDKWGDRRDIPGRALHLAYRLSPLRLLYGWSMFALARPR